MTDEPENFDEPSTQPITTDQLDLHTFRPDECADVVAEFVRAAREDGYRIVRIIHGKGIGTLRTIVHSVLQQHPAVASFTLGDETTGSWGATVVWLRPLEPL